MADVDLIDYQPERYAQRTLPDFGSGVATWTTSTVTMYLIGAE